MTTNKKNKQEHKQEAPAWMAPLSKTEPCGPNLEYDPEYVMLVAKAAPKGDTQYGDFIGVPDAPNWGDIERDCRRILLRSRDISILVLLLRSRTRLAQAEGLREGLAMLTALLDAYPDDIHPQAIVEGEFDLTVRANALATMTDPEGILSDIREIVLIKNSAMRLQVRDVERAFAIPRPADALSAASVRQQLDDLRRSHDKNLSSLTEAARLTALLQAWAASTLDEQAPDLSALTELLGLFARSDRPQAEQATSASSAIAAPVPPMHAADNVIASPVDLVEQPLLPLQAISPGRVMAPSDPLQGREAALQAMIKTREWFEQAEPSSPVAVLLRQAEKLVGKRFSEVVQCIPLELLERWEEEAKNQRFTDN
ncbi:type VI secretion system protein TssA [Collimonas silvisoli]|uniref:type VI secretion system protein TssA n=1 Tax=Collimonas silvisoli TaxID=2825884 RepID=UPI001E432BC8|nr:type VI secretion system ImpA family N-terminal domain-containing protein [Collimonas silvisoli]